MFLESLQKQIQAAPNLFQRGDIMWQQRYT